VFSGKVVKIEKTEGKMRLRRTKGKMRISSTQKIIIGLLSTLLVCLLVSGSMIVYFTYNPSQITDNFTVLNTVLPPTYLPTTWTGDESSISENEPTNSPDHEYVYTPIATKAFNSNSSPFRVFTPTPQIYPSLTPMSAGVSRPAKTSKPKPGGSSNPKPPAPTKKSNSNCQAQLAYAKANHQYELSRIEAIYQPMISYYLNRIDEALRENDAKTIFEYQKKLKSEKDQLENAKKAENRRYESEVAYIKATC